MKSRAWLLILVAVIRLIDFSDARAAVTLFATDATDNTVEVNAINTLSLTTGAATLVGPFNVSGIMAGLAYDPFTGIMYGTSTRNNNLYSINTTTGAATLIGPLGADLMHGLAFDVTTRTLYGAYNEPGHSALFRINATTGAATIIGSIGEPFALVEPTFHIRGVSGLAFRPGTSELYGSVFDLQAGVFTALIKIDVTTGLGTAVSASSTPGNTAGLAFHPVTGVLYGIDNQGSDTLYSIDPSTGVRTLIGNTGLQNNLGLEFAGYRIPEPSTAALFLLAMSFLARVDVHSRSKATALGL